MGKSGEASLAEGALGRMRTLRSNDGVDFQVEEMVAKESETIKGMLEEGVADDVTRLPNVDSKVLRLTIEFCKKHAVTRALSKPAAAATAAATEALSKPATAATAARTEPGDESPTIVANLKLLRELQEFNTRFIKKHDASLFGLMEAAEYLNIKSLKEVTEEAAADKIRGKTPEEIRAAFNIKNDFTSEEEAIARRDNKWVFERQQQIISV